MAQQPFRLATDGDFLESLYWPVFIRDQFPTYEKYWVRFVVPLTTRESDRKNPRLKTDTELAAMRPAKTFFDVYLAQLNYSVLCHLCAAYDLRHSPSTAVTEFDRFTHYIIRLCAAMDVADEMLDRHNSTFSGTNPWGGAVQARQQWRSAN